MKRTNMLFYKPLTELEHWLALREVETKVAEALASNDAYNKEIAEREKNLAWQELDKITQKIAKALDLVSPNDNPATTERKLAKGLMPFEEWSKKIRHDFYQAEFEQIICSACPCCNLGTYIKNPGVIPCRLYSGKIKKLTQPHLCYLLSPLGQDKQGHYRAISDRFGQPALQKFLAKRKALLKQK